MSILFGKMAGTQPENMKDKPQAGVWITHKQQPGVKGVLTGRSKQIDPLQVGPLMLWEVKLGTNEKKFYPAQHLRMERGEDESNMSLRDLVTQRRFDPIDWLQGVTGSVLGSAVWGGFVSVVLSLVGYWGCIQLASSLRMFSRTAAS